MPAASTGANAPEFTDKSRRKNCSACVSSKRRCDKRMPRCTRCTARNFSCVYQSLRYPSAAAPAAANAAAEAGGPPSHAVDLERGGVPTPPQPFDFNNLDNSHPVSVTGAFTDSTMAINELANNNAASALSSIGLNVDASLTRMFDFSSVLVADVMQDSNMHQWDMQPDHVVSKSLAPDPPRVESVCHNREEILGGFQPWQIYEPDSRVGFLVTYFINLHKTFVQTKETPFLHRHLYRGLPSTPRPLITAYTALSAYAGRTESNKGWTIRAVCEGAAEILKVADEDEVAGVSPAAMTGHEKLARAQALCLLQTVRCFDGDVSLRAAAIRDMGVLKRWLKGLEALRDNLHDVHLLDDPALRQRPPRSWEIWVFNECVRRTVFLGHLFTSLFETLMTAGDNRHERSEIAKWMAPHRWTFSKALWEAQSSPEFFSKWRDKPTVIIHSFYVQMIAKVARPGDVDEIARLMLTMLVSPFFEHLDPNKDEVYVC